VAVVVLLVVVVGAGHCAVIDIFDCHVVFVVDEFGRLCQRGLGFGPDGAGAR